MAAPVRAETPSAAAGGQVRVPDRWRRPLGFEAQCWIAWSGLTLFGLSGVLTWRRAGAYPPLELSALVLALCWAIDLVRTGRRLRR